MDTYNQKLTRVRKTLSREEPDRVPAFDLFWQEFIDAWKREKGHDDIYEYYDMDLKLVVPNMDPAVKSFELLERGKDYTVFRSGYGCTLKKADYSPMPEYVDYAVKDADGYEDFVLEDPEDDRRYFQASANILSSAGDIEAPAFSEQVGNARDRFPTMGLVLEGSELLTRIRGMEGMFLDVMLEADRVRRFLDRLLAFEIALGVRQIRMGVDFMYVGGDIAYDKGMFYSPDVWRAIFKPFVKTLCRELRAAKPDIRFIYHNCGNASAVFDDLIECGIDAIQPLEVKAGLDVVELKRKYGRRVAFVGNMDAQHVLPGDTEGIRRALLRNLNAAKGGGYIPMSDHSVPDTVSVSNFDYYSSLLRRHGRYPLDLGELDEEMGAG
jgi:uroporphyrinogen decarboxylase